MTEEVQSQMQAINTSLQRGYGGYRFLEDEYGVDTPKQTYRRVRDFIAQMQALSSLATKMSDYFTLFAKFSFSLGIPTMSILDQRNVFSTLFFLLHIDRPLLEEALCPDTATTLPWGEETLRRMTTLLTLSPRSSSSVSTAFQATQNVVTSSCNVPSNFQCSYCHRKRHSTPEKCWSLHPELTPENRKRTFKSFVPGLSSDVTESASARKKPKLADRPTPNDQILTATSVFSRYETVVPPADNSFVLNSGATHHVTNDSSLLSDFVPVDDPLMAVLTAGHDSVRKGQFPVLGTGTIHMRTEEGRIVAFVNVRFVPAFRFNCISMIRVAEAGVRLQFSDTTVDLPGHGVIGRLSKDHSFPSLMYVPWKVIRPHELCSPVAPLAGSSTDQNLHTVFGNPGAAREKLVAQSFGVSWTSLSRGDLCGACLTCMLRNIRFLPLLLALMSLILFKLSRRSDWPFGLHCIQASSHSIHNGSVYSLS